MNKPLTLAVQETEQQIVEIINNSGLPAFCLKSILRNLYEQTSSIEQQEIMTYQNKLKEESENDKKTKKDNK